MESSQKLEQDEHIDLVKSIPFLIVHLIPLAAIWTGVRLADLVVCAALYFGRMFFVTAGFHRYFAHRSYKMGRVMQFIMAFCAQTSAQKGALWWAAHHRDHHRYSDTDKDVHSPLKGFWWSHVGWILSYKTHDTKWSAIKDFAKYPELRWLNHYHLVPAITLGAVCYMLGGWGTLVVGFFWSTVLLYHGTFTINSLSHIFGRRRFVTSDTSRNSFLLAMITLGEGWHNNHHYYQAATRQGFFWWEVDISYYILRFLSLFGLVYDLREPPAKILAENRLRDGYADIGMFEAYWTKATKALANARRASGELQQARKKALEDMLINAKSAAQQVARMSVPPRPSIPSE